MSEAEYTYSTSYQRPRRGVPGTFIPEISGPDGQFTGPRFDTELAATTWAEKYIDAKAAGLVQPARPVQAAPAVQVAASPSTSPRVPQVHRQAQAVATILGLRAPRATRGCYYCGMPLRSGVCEDCG